MANKLPTGKVVIRGSALPDEIVYVDTTGVSDADGFGSFISYAWYINGSYVDEGRATTSDPNATGYQFTAFDVGKIFTVKYTFYDAVGKLEVVESAGVMVGYLGAINGTLGADTLFGTSGNDRLYGFYSNDYLDGGSGGDYLFGGSGSDVLKGGAGIDALEGGFGNDTIWGGADSDSLAGQDGNDQLFGDDGEDQLWGNGGNDSITGGAENDILFGGDGLTDWRAAGPDSVVGDGKDSLFGGDGADVLHGLGDHDLLYGGLGQDTIFGESGNDALDGGIGADMLTGGIGKDLLKGGSGNDIFIFNAGAESGITTTTADVISDFVRGQDKIDLSSIDAFASTGDNDTFLWNGTLAFNSTTQGELRYQQFNNSGTANDYTMVWIDNDADPDVEMAIRLTGLFTLTASDFAL